MPRGLRQWLAVGDEDAPEVLELLKHISQGAPILPALGIADRTDGGLADVRRVEMRRRAMVLDDALRQSAGGPSAQNACQRISSASAALIAVAVDEGYPALSLSVALANPALRLYERLGFVAVSVTEAHQTMRLEL